MQKKQMLSTLVDLGLTKNEAVIYVNALSLGQTTILKLARAAEMKRTSVYSIIDSLQQKGLISIEQRGFKQWFVAEPPEKLETILEARRNKLKTVLPEFSALYHVKGGESTIHYYEGLESVKSVYEGLIRDIRPREDYLILADLRLWLHLDEDFFMDFIRRRAKLNINIRMLTQDSAVAREHKRLQKNYHETIKILPKGTTLTTNLVIIPKKVVIHQLVPPIFAMVIENKNVIQMHREQFEIMWQSISE